MPVAQASVRSAWLRGIRPPPRRTVDQWADAVRVLGPSEGPIAGPWRTDRTPYLRDVMACLTLSHPAWRVTFKASAQVGKTQCGLNFLGQVLTETPAPVLVVLPSNDEAGTYNRDKLDPMLQATPALREAVKELVGRDGSGSTTRVKRGAGGAQCELVGANSSKGLQMRSVRVVLFEEPTEYPTDVDGRGDPMDLGLARTIAYHSSRKVGDVSTPGLAGSCRITALYEQGSRGVYHVPCPDCGHRQPLDFERLTWSPGKPETAAYACVACGVLIPHERKRQMVAAGAWVHERPELVEQHASFTISALYSPFVTWKWVAEQAERAASDVTAAKAFDQQVLGRAHEGRYDVPDFEILTQRREALPPRRIPPWCLFMTSATDVQGNRLEWATYGWDRHLGGTLIDGGILEGDPTQDEVWQRHDELLARQWVDAWDRPWSATSWGVDAGYLSQRVYAYCRRHAARRAPALFALDGRARWGLPAIGSARAVDVDYRGRKIGEVAIHPVGTWDLKAEVAAALKLTEQGPDPTGTWPRGAMRFPAWCSTDFFQQITAEACIQRPTRNGIAVREWVKLKGRPRNEQLDLAVYARALARHETGRLTDDDWARLIAQRQGAAADVQASLFPTGLLATVEAAAPAPSPAAPLESPPAPVPRAPPPRVRFEQRNWFGR